MIKSKVLSTLEYDKILERLKKFAASERAKSDILRLSPSTEYQKVSALLDETVEADIILYEYDANLSLCFDDICPVLERAKKMSLLTPEEILKIGRFLKAARQTKIAVMSVEDVRITLLREKANLLYIDKTLEERIISSIIGPYEIADTASAELKAIRDKIKKCNEEIRAKLNHFITSASYQKYLQDNVVTVRDGRHVILVKSQFKGMIPGLVHGQSATGATLYVEPMSVFEMNNKLKALLSDEEFEKERILREFTAIIGANHGFLSYGFELMTELDIIFAKAAYAKSINAVRPEIDKKNRINIIYGRHPLINERSVVPVSIKLGGEYNILMITGPNTGGKTVTLKLTGLLTLMAQTGLFIPAHEDSSVGVFSAVFSDIGDEQSIEQSLSTFSSHMTNIIKILDEFDKNSLLLLDELGAGTDPAEGAALALAITSHIKNKGAKAVITTHYDELKEFSLTEAEIENASMDFDPVSFEPTYKLIIGIPGASNAIRIAERLGLNGDIVKHAESLIGSERRQFENIIISAERARKKAVENFEISKKEREETERRLTEVTEEQKKLDKERERFRADIKKQTQRLIEEAAEEAEAIISSLKEQLKKNDESALFEANRLKKRLENLAAKDNNEEQGAFKDSVDDKIIREDGEIEPGCSVYVKSIKAKGIVADVSTKNLLIKIGAVTTRIKIDDVFKIKSQNSKETKVVNINKPLNIESVPSEINLLGKNIDEAIYMVDNFIDRAVTGGLGEVKIIHGVGTGKLGRAIQQHLSAHKNAASFRYGVYGEGERGVTFVKLK
ncbi:MAG: endonuclease MutS2 [Clostridiales bacterium]|jgi:DNA mismatch repair protein MutS2|nr:endonuclease MutS2 [Clostridiales bacterium]